MCRLSLSRSLTIWEVPGDLFLRWPQDAWRCKAAAVCIIILVTDNDDFGGVEVVQWFV